MGARQKAKLAGFLHYNTGKPCSRGHMSDRFVKGGNCRECLAENCKKWSDGNQVYNLDRYKKYRERISKEIKQSKGKIYRLENANAIKIRQRNWNQANKDKRCEYARETAHKRRASKSMVRSDLTRDQIKDLIKAQNGRCAYCLEKATLTLDHIIALSRGGENTRSNVQMLCQPCNLSKGAKDPIDFMQSRGFLL